MDLTCERWTLPVICAHIGEVDGGAILIYDQYFKRAAGRKTNLTRLSDVSVWPYLICLTSIIAAVWCVNYFESRTVDTSECEIVTVV